MDNNLELQQLKQCLELIEKKLGRGNSAEWTGYDFEMLSLEIQEATGVVLSTTTLKRLWGRLKYASMPTVTTLNTLAKFAGYNDWSEFKQKANPEATVMERPTEPAPRKRGFKWQGWFLGALLLLIIGCLFFVFKADTETLANSSYRFSSNKIKTAGVPNSVVFDYDATASGSDSVFIAQSWDVSRKAAVNKNGHTYSSIYYNPGYFRAKLIIGKKIVKEHDLMISSDGWLAMVYKNGEVPLYFKKDEVLQENKIEVGQNLLAQYNVALQPSLPEVRFFNVRDLGGLKNDNFVLETSLKSDFNRGTGACQQVKVLILCKGDMISIPLCSKGCVGDLSLRAVGRDIESKSADLSKFGCDLSQWVKLRVESSQRRIRFLVNGEEAYSLTFANKASEIVGLQYRFNGTGAVKDTRLMANGKVIEF